METILVIAAALFLIALTIIATRRLAQGIDRIQDELDKAFRDAETKEE